ncbi:MAG: CgeB family protein [Phycisphaerae bacterium]
MRIAMFYHSLLSDWNHGNAHFLRGVATELQQLGHRVSIYEPRNAWSMQNLVAEHGEAPLEAFETAYPSLHAKRYELETMDLEQELLADEPADVVIVHEWSDHTLVKKIGELRARTGAFTLLFHDTHHRAITDESAMAKYDLGHYDGVLAFGKVLRDLYLRRRWTRRAFTWHEAADTRVFFPISGYPCEGDLVWVGNWGDDERTSELQGFLLSPVKRLGLRARIHGVRYPESALMALKEAGIQYAGWLPNFLAPEVFARFKVTVHVPRRPYVEALPGIPTIRVFEALACGIPLVCAPWNDSEGLFTPGKDYLVARDGKEMDMHLQHVLSDKSLAGDLAAHGLHTILSRHTCGHRAVELLGIIEELKSGKTAPSEELSLMSVES